MGCGICKNDKKQFKIIENIEEQRLGKISLLIDIETNQKYIIKSINANQRDLLLEEIKR